MVVKSKIGLEIHFQLTSLSSKLFCSCDNDYRSKHPNSNLCEICSGQPGSLPLLNQTAVEFSAMVSLALGCHVPDKIMFYRKNYFYPDLPKNFQLTQYNAYGVTSIGVQGELQYGDGNIARIRRVQLEEDPGRLAYGRGESGSNFFSLIDYNRAGVSLVEVITDPDFSSPKDVRMFLNKISSILEYLGVCDTKLDGSVRCDANISIDGGKKVEIKNVNSFKEVEKALSYEIARQKTLITHKIDIKAETRHWDDVRRITIQAREKEAEHDYRYFPEPDIPTVILGNNFISLLESKMPELPDARKTRFITNYEISDEISQILVDNKKIADFFESATNIYSSPKEIANWIVTDLMGFLDETADSSPFLQSKVEPKHIAELAKMVDENNISRKTGKAILSQIIKTGEMPSKVVNETDASMIDSISLISETIDIIFSSEKAAVQDAKNNPNTINFLLGKVMQLTKARADPKITLSLIRKKLVE